MLIIEIEVVSETTEEEMQAAEGDKQGVTVAYTKPSKPSQVCTDSVGGGDKPQLTEGVTVAYTKPAKPSQVCTDSVGGG